MYQTNEVQNVSAVFTDGTDIGYIYGSCYFTMRIMKRVKDINLSDESSALVGEDGVTYLLKEGG